MFLFERPQTPAGPERHEQPAALGDKDPIWDGERRGCGSDMFPLLLEEYSLQKP